MIRERLDEGATDCVGRKTLFDIRTCLEHKDRRKHQRLRPTLTRSARACSDMVCRLVYEAKRSFQKLN